MKKVYTVCQTCVMDTSDPTISFDISGVCNHCRNYKASIEPSWKYGDGSSQVLAAMSRAITKRGSGEFDCIIGVSGGLDSSYAAYVAKEQMGLKPLLFHVDAGWNTAVAVENIACLVDGLNLELHTEVVDWEAVRRTQLAFFRSGIPDLDLVQDAAFFSSLYTFARKHGIKSIITGSNFSTECCREPEAWGGYLGIDKTLFRDILQKSGENIDEVNFPLVDIFVYKILFRRIMGMQVYHPLNHVKFVKTEAEDILHKKFGWTPFKHKHHESRFTRFFEDFWLRKKFGYDKRKAHFSSLIMTSQMDRDAALERLLTGEMPESFWAEEFRFIARKLDISEDELCNLFHAPNKIYSDYRNKRKYIKYGARILRLLQIEKRLVG